MRYLQVNVDVLGHIAAISKVTHSANNNIPVTIASVQYNELNLAQNVTDGLSPSNSYQYSYDIKGRSVTETDPNTKRTEFTFDEDQNLEDITTQLGFEDSMFHDGEGSVNKWIDPRSDTVASPPTIIQSFFEHDGEQRILSWTNRLSNKFKWTYDDVGRSISLQTPLEVQAGANGPSRSVSFDSSGRPLAVVSPMNVYNFNVHGTGFDAEGRPTDVKDGLGERISSYCPNGLLNTVSETIGGVSVTTSRVYDEVNRLKEYHDGYGHTFAYSYYPDNHVHQITYPDQLVVTYTYDDYGRLWKVQDLSSGASVPRTTTYSYDNNGNVLSISRANGTSVGYAYDGDNRVCQINDISPSNELIYYEGLGYDDDGRIKWSFSNPNPPNFASPGDQFTFDADNQLLSWNGGTANVSRDDDGNLKKGPLPNGQVGTFAYDVRDRLIGVGSNTPFNYNPDGVRTEAPGPTGATYYMGDADGATLASTVGGVTTDYIYDLGLRIKDTRCPLKVLVGAHLALARCPVGDLEGASVREGRERNPAYDGHPTRERRERGRPEHSVSCAEEDRVSRGCGQAVNAVLMLAPQRDLGTPPVSTAGTGSGTGTQVRILAYARPKCPIAATSCRGSSPVTRALSSV